MRRLLRRRLVLWAAFGAFATGCLSPTLPLPPPATPEITQIGVEEYRLQGTLPVQGSVLAQNARTRLIYGQANVVAYNLIVVARPGDAMILWYEVGEGASDSTIFQIDADGASPAPQVRDAGSDGKSNGKDGSGR